MSSVNTSQFVKEQFTKDKVVIASGAKIVSEREEKSHKKRVKDDSKVQQKAIKQSAEIFVQEVLYEFAKKIRVRGFNPH